MKLTDKFTHTSRRDLPSRVQRIGWAVFFSAICPMVPLAADTANPANGTPVSSGNYSNPGSGNSLPSGTYSNPSSSVPPPVSAQNAPTWQGGRLPFLISASISEVYDDNIYIQPTKTSDFITQINLKGEYRIGNQSASDGNYLDLSYAPSFDIYANHSSQDSFNQNADLFYQHRFSKLALSLEQIYSKQSATSAAAGNLVTSNDFITNAGAQYTYSDKLSLIGQFTFDSTNYQTTGYSSSNEYVGNLYFLYKLDSKISVGAGPMFGWTDVTQAPDQTFQELLGHLNYNYSGRLSFTGSAGVAFYQYDGPSAYDTVNGVFSLSGNYQLSDDTMFSLTGSRGFNPSYNFHGQNYVATIISPSLRQRFYEKFAFNLAFGYENDDYQSAGVAITGPNRVDNYYFVTTGVDWNPNSWLRASIFYKYQLDNSTVATSCFNDNQVGVSASVAY